MKIRGIGSAMIARLRWIESEGGAVRARDWFAHVGRANRMPSLMSAGLVSAIGACDLESRAVECFYQLTELAREFLRELEEVER